MKEEEEGLEIVAASGVDGALEAIRAEQAIDSHPEKRMKGVRRSCSLPRQAFKAYLEEKMPEVKEEYPGLKFSQYHDMVFKMVSDEVWC